MGAKPALAISPVLSIPHGTTEPAWLTPAALVAVDFISLSIAYSIAAVAHSILLPKTADTYLHMFPGILLFLGAFWAQGLYPGVLVHPAEEIRRVYYCATTVLLLIASSTYLFHTSEFSSRAVFLFTWIAGTPMVLIARHLARHYLSRTSWWGVSAVVLGSGTSAQRVVRTLADKTLGVNVKGVLTEHAAVSWPHDLPPILGDVGAAPQVTALGIAQYVILAMPLKSSMELRHTIQDCCRGFRHVLLVPDMPGLCSLGISTREIAGEVGFELPQRLFHRSAAMTKRCMDCFISALILAFLSPLLGAIALAIRLSSPGSIFYGHARHGRDGRTFKALKFRTMVQNSDRVLQEYLARHPAARLEWQKDHKLRNDPRVTWIGKWLRRYSLDELPQLWNVVQGQMSLVGPRPIVDAEIPKYGRGFGLYTRVRPGITGLWQVSGRNNTTYEERVGYDEYYVRNWSIWLDAYILVRTIRVVLCAEGAY